MTKKKSTEGKTKKILLIAIPVVLLTAAITYAVIQKPRFVACKQNEEINQQIRAEVEKQALAFTQEIVGAKNAEAYARLTAETQKNLTTEQFSGIQQSISQFGIKDLKLANTYYANVIGGKEIKRATCGNLSDPEQWVSINLKPSAKQAYVLVDGLSVNNSAQFILWLEENNNSWQVQNFIISPTTILDKNYKDILQIARAELEKKHQLNSFLLYISSYQLASRGPDFQLGTLPLIEKEMNNVVVPKEFQGEPPHKLQDGNLSFSILGMGPIAVEGKMYLMINHEVEPWASERAAERNNRNLIATLKKLYPEYKDVFAGAIIRGFDKKNNLFYGTVEDKPAAAVKAAPQPAAQETTETGTEEETETDE